MKRKYSVITLVAALVLSAFACSSGGGGGGGVVAPSCVSLTGGTAPSNGTVVARQGASTSCSTLEVDLVATQINNVFAGEFTINYDASIVSYSNHSTTGSALTADGTALQVISTPGPGQITIAFTRLTSTLGGVNIGATDTLIKLFFSRVSSTGTSTGPLSVTNARLFDDQTPPVEIPGVTWSGATLNLQ